MRKFLSIIFVLLLLAPTLVWILRVDFDINVKRMGLKPPRFDSRSLLDNDYYRAFDQYLNDSFSLRDPLVFAKRWLDYHVFGTSDTADVHVGRHGWLYSRQSIEDVQKKACSDAGPIQRLSLALHAVDRIFTASGRRFAFTVAPNKSTIYPEFLGYIPANDSCRRSRYDLLLEAFQNHPLKAFIRVDQQLKKAKNGQTWLYHPMGAYWNVQGAIIAAEALGEWIVGHGAGTMSFKYTQHATADQFDLAGRMLGLFEKTDNGTYRQLTSSGSRNLNDAVVYGDEYLNNLIPYMAQMFDRIEVVQTVNVPSRQHGENWQDADIILVQIAESEIASLRLDVDQIFASLESTALVSTHTPINMGAFLPGTDIALEKQPQGLQIKSVGKSSRLALISIPGSDRHVFRVLKLTVASQHSDIMTFALGTNSSLMISKALKPGVSKLYLPLPFQPTLTLRVNPGTKPGVLLLQAAKILAFDNRDKSDKSLLDKSIIAHAQTDPESASSKPGPAAPPSTGDAASEISQETLIPSVQPEKPPRKISAKSIQTAAADNSADRKIPPRKIESTPQKKIESDSKAKSGTSAASATNTKIQASKTEGQPAKTEISPSVRLNDFAEGRIFQRHGNSADIVISGTYTGPVDAIEARIVGSETHAQIVSWAIIDPAPANGIFVGRLADIPQGGWYNLQVRSHSNHSVFDNGRHRWGVGMLVACLGQSNMKEWFHTGNDLKAHSLLRTFSSRGWSKTGTRGNAAIAFGNRVIGRLGIPVGLLDFAVNGSGLRKEADWGTGYWLDTAPDSIYDRFIRGVSAAGGRLESVIWIQGEADAARGSVTEEEYAGSLTHFIENQIRIDISNGSNRERLPFLVVMMIKRPGGKDQPHQAIRNAQKQVTENVADCYLAATTLDLNNHGRQHLKPKAYISMGKRVAQTVLHIAEKENYHRGPRVVNVRQIGDRTVEIKIKHSGGNDFEPVSGISGWEIIANGRHVPIENVYRHDTETIHIVTRAPLTQMTSIRYLYGAMPDVHHAVLDNSPLSLPLEEYQAEIN